MNVAPLAAALLIGVPALGACVHSAAYVHRVEAAYPASGKVVEVAGHDVHVLTAGEAGPPVLAIHGASANAREFTWSLAPRLARDHRVLMPDRPGHGHSARPPDAASLGVQARQMAGALDALAPETPAVIVGHSYGGAVALRVALDYPERVRGVVLLAPVTHDWGGGGEAWYNRVAGLPLIGPIFSQAAPLAGPAAVESGVDNVFDPDTAPDGYLENSAINLLFRPSAFRANARDMTRLRAELMAQQDRYGEIEVPVVIFSGARDRIISPRLHAGRLQHVGANFKLVKLPDQGHMPHHGEGEAVANAIRDLARARDAR